MDEEWKKGEWQPDENIPLKDPLHVTDEEWKQRYDGERRGRNLMAAGCGILLVDLVFSLFEAIGNWIDDILDRRDERKKNQ